MAFTLTLAPLRSPLDSRRGIVRLHPQVVAEMGLRPWEPVKLTGARTTGALTAQAPADIVQGLCLADALTCFNAGVLYNHTVLVEPVKPSRCDRLELAIPVGLPALADPLAICHALEGKVIYAGDRVSLLPQDFVRSDSVGKLHRLVRYLSSVFGREWQEMSFLVAETSPRGCVVVTDATQVEWAMPTSTEAEPEVEGIAVYEATPAAESREELGRAHLPRIQVSASEPLPNGVGYVSPGFDPTPHTARPTAPPPAPDLYESALANNPEAEQYLNATPAEARLEDLGGLDEQIRQLREWFDVSFRQQEMLARLKISPLDGVLLHGLPGTGKTSLIKAVAAAEGAKLTVIEGRQFSRTDPTAAAKAIREIFRGAVAPPPQIIAVENIEELAPAPGEGGGTPLTSVLLEELRDASSRPAVAVVGITSHPERTSPELRGPGLLDHALEIPPPNESERKEIIAIHCRSLPLSPEVSLDELAHRTPGYVGADIHTLCRQAGVNAISRQQRARRESGDTGDEVLLVTAEDFEAALALISPTSMADASLEIADVSFEDVGDMVETKNLLQEAVIWPIRFPDTFARLALKPSRGVLLYGPPGCGKTFLVKALAHEAEANFLAVKGAELLSKWVGESERSVRDLFGRARSAAPAIIFFDEIDALTPTRGKSVDSVTDRVVAQILTELDGIEELKGVWVIGATNRPDMVDGALIRPGRLDRMIYVPPPDRNARLEILKATTKYMPVADDVDFEHLADATGGYSAADLAGLARQAGLSAIRRDMSATTVTAWDFEVAFQEVRPSLKPEDLARLEEFTKTVAS